jgi:DNA-binding MarR family transcriptional regulator
MDRKTQQHRDGPGGDDEPLLRETAYVLLETVPSLMGFVSNELRRRSHIDNPVHFRLLRTLRRGRRSLHELADRQGVRLPTMSRTVSVLESRGWVERERSSEDRRTVYTKITGRGQKVLDEVEKLAIGRASELLDCLPRRDLEKLRDGLNTLYEVIHEQLGSSVEDGPFDSHHINCEESGE